MFYLLIGFWCSLVFLVVYHHVLYPWLLNRFVPVQEKNDRTVAPKDLPFITMVIPCYNESAVIADKLRNLAFIDYPTRRFKVTIINDGSTDNTAAIVAQTCKEDTLESLDIQFINCKENRGKISRLNEALENELTEILVLSDASALISIDAFQRLASRFDDADVGVVCATYEFLNEENAGERRYWDYQRKVKMKESATGSTLGAHGALYAFRASCLNSIPKDTINDDFVLPMMIVSQGYRCVYDTSIVAVELEQAGDQQNYSRRQRIAAGNLQQSLRLVHLLNPKHGWVTVNFFSGKWLRSFMPFILLALFGISAALQGQGAVYSLAFFSQLSVYGIAAARYVFAQLAWPKIVEVIYYIVSGYVASLIGSIHYLVNPQHFENWARADDVVSDESYLPASTLIFKRIFDVVVASVGVLLTLPLWPLIAIAIRIESKGPIFYRQQRVGRSLPKVTELFHMIKFRTMALDAEAATGAVWASENDPRITRVGRFLRKTRLDELPQLLNVLLGEMSIVGPRPERPGISRDLDAAIPFYAERTFFVCPGITGFAQVNQGYDTCLDDVKNKLLYDHAYAVSLSRVSAWIKMDVFIMLKTVWVMVAGRGQ
jgi:lipopolysaccharide/colanic/teichoic acid biosynthesis glycosyltransferase/glycosyltransferase involved in cell wall biosynthesis